MIFDNDVVTKLVISWQKDKNPDTLASITEGSKNLIEAIVSMYNPQCRDDLIQEAYLKLIRALDIFDPYVASLHTYLTTVIRNACISWLSKYDDGRTVEFDDLDVLASPLNHTKSDLGIITADLIARNRERFPSLPVNVVDEITEEIMSRLKGGILRTKLVTYIAERLGYDRSLVNAICVSTIVYLRHRYSEYRCGIMPSNVEFTLLPELRDLVGDPIYRQIIIMFSGFSVRFP